MFHTGASVIVVDGGEVEGAKVVVVFFFSTIAGSSSGGLGVGKSVAAAMEER